MIHAMYAGEFFECRVKQLDLMLPLPVVVSSKFQLLASEAGLPGCRRPADDYAVGRSVLGGGRFQAQVGAVSLALARCVMGAAEVAGGRGTGAEMYWTLV